jgi:hypothetical protein
MKMIHAVQLSAAHITVSLEEISWRLVATVVAVVIIGILALLWDRLFPT